LVHTPAASWYSANQTITFPVPESPLGVAFDGENIWVTTAGVAISKLRANDGTNLGNSPVGILGGGVAFDGANFWITTQGFGGAVSKLQASNGGVIGSFLTGNNPRGVAFDDRVANRGDNTVS